jgi:hypothetical protein
VVDEDIEPAEVGDKLVEDAFYALRTCVVRRLLSN